MFTEYLAPNTFEFLPADTHIQMRTILEVFESKSIVFQLSS